MGHCHDTTREESFKQLSRDERMKIESALRHGASTSAIARELGRSVSAISREISRGSCVQESGGRSRLAYFAELGQARRDAARAAGGASRKDSLPFVRDVDRAMRETRAAGLRSGPDGHAGRLAASGAYGPGEIVSTRSLYNYISKGLMETKTMDLPMKPRLRPGKKGNGGHPKENKRVLGESIEKRPAAVAERARFGDWEAGLVEGGREADEALLVMIERKTRFYIIRKIHSKRQEDVMEGMKGVPRGPARSRS
jgi:IS30 family transposase